MLDDMNKLRERLKQYRISSSMTQKNLADLSGVSVRSISRYENGEDIGLANFIKLLDALDLSGHLEVLIPDQTKRPSYYLDENKKRQRASSKKTSRNRAAFVWGDEK